MINYKRGKLIFTGKHYQDIKDIAKELGLSVQNTVTGMLWEAIMRKAREGVFKREKTKDTRD